MRNFTLPGTDLTVSSLCYGGVSWGTRASQDDMDILIGAFRDAGGNFFDTAHCYSFFQPHGTGASELALAAYFKRNGGLDEVVIATKGGHPGHAGYRHIDRYLSPERIGADLDDSLGRLEVESIDLYWLHRDDLRVPAGEIIETLENEVRRGRIRHYGASNWTSARIDAANAYAAEHAMQGFVASQPEWCLAHPNTGVRDASLHFFSDADCLWHERSGMPVIPYTSTAGGYFATGGNSAKAGFDNEVSRARLERVESLARELGQSPNQIALAYLTSRTFPVAPIIGTLNLEHLRDAITAMDIRLTAGQAAWVAGG